MKYQYSFICLGIFGLLCAAQGDQKKQSDTIVVVRKEQGLVPQTLRDVVASQVQNAEKEVGSNQVAHDLAREVSQGTASTDSVPGMWSPRPRSEKPEEE
ncbi:hypothetical protein EBR77_03250 [bacterium]|nr:hypothetical protein [bacterium]NBX78314.1 hypothetical protein [bacterium]